MALFGMAGQIIAYSGYQSDFAAMDGSRNIPFILANGVTQMSGRFYPLFAPFLGAGRAHSSPATAPLP